MDDHGHGTVNAGIAGARTDNGVGVAGLAGSPGDFDHVWIMAVKVLDNNNWGLYSWWEEGLYYAANNNASVINMSMGGTSFSSTLQSAVTYACNQGCVVVAAMGNNNSNTPQYPAAFSNTIAVGATDTDDSRCVPPDWQNFGMPTGGSNFGSHIDVVAPGNWIYSTAWNDTYAYWSGTSMAAPFVSGLAGLIIMQAPVKPSPDEVRQIIQSTAEDQVGLASEDTPGWDQYYGHGRINANGAIQALAPAGDANGDGTIDIGDVVYLINYLYKGGPAPEPLDAGDANSDGVIDIGDVVYLINYLYKGGPSPCSGTDGDLPANSAKLTAGSGHAEIWPVLNVDQNTATHTQSSGNGFDKVSQISVIGRYDVEVTGVELKIEFDPDQVTMLDPQLSPLTGGLQLFAGAEDGTQRIGMVDLSGTNYFPPGEGTLITLRARGSDLSSIEIKKATLVDLDARPLAVELSGELNLDVAKGSESRPQRFSLSQNYPNPFNPRTSIRYALPQDAQVRLTIYNVLGQKVATLLDEPQSAGFKTIWWDGKDADGYEVSSGVYFYRLTAGEFSEVKKMMMVK
ncbi:MAG: S8 family serine peptidase [Candidatus Zixiibacteriota bacterium]